MLPSPHPPDLLRRANGSAGFRRRGNPLGGKSSRSNTRARRKAPRRKRLQQHFSQSLLTSAGCSFIGSPAWNMMPLVPTPGAPSSSSEASGSLVASSAGGPPCGPRSCTNPRDTIDAARTNASKRPRDQDSGDVLGIPSRGLTASELPLALFQPKRSRGAHSTNHRLSAAYRVRPISP